MTDRKLVPMGTRTTRSGYSQKGMGSTGHRFERGLIASSLIFGTAVTLILSDYTFAIPKDQCLVLGGEIIVSSGQEFCCLSKDGSGPPNDCTTPVEGAAAPSATPLRQAQPVATPAQPVQGSTKPLTPAVKTPPPVQVRKPDLLPIPNPNASAGPAGFCTKDPAGKLVVHVKNQGVAAAPASTTVVHLWKSGHAVKRDIIPTPVIPAGGMVSLPGVDVPPSPFPPNLVFTITVDGQSVIDESSEMNNRVEGKCV